MGEVVVLTALGVFYLAFSVWLIAQIREPKDPPD